MDFGLREVLIIIGLVVIAGIVFDGYRRMRLSRLGELDLPMDKDSSENPEGEDEWDYYKTELPNGGARKIQFGKDSTVSEVRRKLVDDFEPDVESDFGSALDGELEEDDAEPTTRLRAARSARPKPQGNVHRMQPTPTAPQDTKPEHKAVADSVDSDEDLFADDDLLVAARSEQEAKLARHTGSAVAKEEPQSPIEIDPELQEVMVVNIMARDGEIPGADLQRVLVSCGFRFGEMNIFHRYEQHSGKGGLLFSAANVVEPGVFDESTMETFSTPGICLFMSLPGPRRPMHAFELLMDTSRKIATLLDADIKDENHNVMRQQTAEHYRQRVLDFERRYLSFKASQKQL